MGKAQNLGAQTDFGFEIRVLLYLSQPGIFFLCQSDGS